MRQQLNLPSAIIEPIVNALQSKSLDLFHCSKDVTILQSIITDHRQNADNVIKNLLKDAEGEGEGEGEKLISGPR